MVSGAYSGAAATLQAYVGYGRHSTARHVPL
jgi:hypothetical protein